MIFDHIKNISLYKGLTPAIDTALDYIAKVTPEVENGTYFLDNGVKVVISEYTTRLVNEKGYEAHKRFADIQFCIVGTELVRCKPLPRLRRASPTTPTRMLPATPIAPVPTSLWAKVTSSSSSPRTPTSPALPLMESRPR